MIVRPRGDAGARVIEVPFAYPRDESLHETPLRRAALSRTRPGHKEYAAQARQGTRTIDDDTHRNGGVTWHRIAAVPRQPRQRAAPPSDFVLGFPAIAQGATRIARRYLHTLARRWPDVARRHLAAWKKSGLDPSSPVHDGRSCSGDGGRIDRHALHGCRDLQLPARGQGRCSCATRSSSRPPSSG